jgi:hypoxanthine phosphoribosyltransferase
MIKTSGGAAAVLTESVAKPSLSMFLPEEMEFYRAYPWAINAAPSFKELVDFLRRELTRIDVVARGWQAVEVVNNIYLLCCAISDVADDWLLSDRYDFSRARGFFPARLALAPLEKFLALRQSLVVRRLEKFEPWRKKWEVAVDGFLGEMAGSQMVFSSPRELAELLEASFPEDILRRRARIPAAFRSQDLTPHDIFSLGKAFASEYSDTARPILILGLRTAGSYFAPLLCAYLKTNGYRDIHSLTVRPKRGMSVQESARIVEIAARGGLIAIVDEPVNTGGTLIRLIGQLRKMGLGAQTLCGLFPMHPNRTDWDSGYTASAYANIKMINLWPEKYFKRALLDVEHVREVLSQYYGARGLHVELVSEAFRLNARLRDMADLKFHDRLKGAYVVRLRDSSGVVEQRCVLAKSVGWGWLGYHAFLCGERLCGLVPPVLGLRDGILYCEWVQDAGFPDN